MVTQGLDVAFERSSIVGGYDKGIRPLTKLFIFKLVLIIYRFVRGEIKFADIGSRLFDNGMGVGASISKGVD